MPYRAFRRKLTASFFAPFILVLTLLAVFVLWGIDNQVSLTRWVEHSDQVMVRAKDAEIELRDMQIAYRGYFFISAEQRQATHLAEARGRFNEDLLNWPPWSQTTPSKSGA